MHQSIPERSRTKSVEEEKIGKPMNGGWKKEAVYRHNRRLNYSGATHQMQYWLRHQKYDLRGLTAAFRCR